MKRNRGRSSIRLFASIFSKSSLFLISHQHHQQQQPRRKNHPLQRGHIDLSPLKQQAQLICHALSPTVRQKQNNKYINANLQTHIHKYSNTDTHFMIMTINEECIFNCTGGTICPVIYCPSDILSQLKEVDILSQDTLATRVHQNIKKYSKFHSNLIYVVSI